MSEHVAAALARVPAERRAAAPVVFTAHSIPTAMAAASPYVAQITEGARLIAARVGHANWSIAYQSRSGSPREPWLEPDICEVVRALARDGGRDLVVVPIGFVCDHVEVLYDLDIEARQVAEAAGINFVRASTVNDHPAFIRMLADVVRQRDGTSSDSLSHLGRGGLTLRSARLFDGAAPLRVAISKRELRLQSDRLPACGARHVCHEQRFTADAAHPNGRRPKGEGEVSAAPHD